MLFHNSKAHIRAVLGGNRSGKTTCGAVEFLWHITRQYPDWYPDEMKYTRAVKGRIFCEDFSKSGARVIVPALEDWLDLELIKSKKKNPMGFPIYWEMKNGSTFEILTYEQKTQQYEGWKGDIAWFDEPPPRDKYVASTRGLVDSGGRCWLTLTPLSQPWIHDEIVAGADGVDTFSIGMDIRDNLIRVEDGVEHGHLSEASIKLFEKKLKPEEREARIHGKFLHLTGLVFKQFDPNMHVIKDMEIPAHWTRYMAIDPHPRTPTAVLWMAVDEQENFFVYDEMFLADMDAKEIANAIKAQEGTEPAKLRYIDPAMDKDHALAGGFNIRKELMRYGIYTIRANNEWEYGKDALDRAITPKWNPFLGQEAPQLRIIGSDCPRLIWEITHYVWETNPILDADKQKRQKPTKKDDHMMDCLRYILAANPRFLPEENDEVIAQPTYKGEYTKHPAANPERTGNSYRELVD